MTTQPAALVTGGAQRLGRAIVLALAGAGRPVAIHYRHSRDEAAALARGVSIHVEASNPARRLYDRKGFREVGQDGPYIRMEWFADGAWPAT